MKQAAEAQKKKEEAKNEPFLLNGYFIPYILQHLIITLLYLKSDICVKEMCKREILDIYNLNQKIIKENRDSYLLPTSQILDVIATVSFLFPEREVFLEKLND